VKNLTKKTIDILEKESIIIIVKGRETPRQEDE
jgi:hypothetical protein